MATIEKFKIALKPKRSSEPFMEVDGIRINAWTASTRFPGDGPGCWVVTHLRTGRKITGLHGDGHRMVRKLKRIPSRRWAFLQEIKDGFLPLTEEQRAVGQKLVRAIREAVL